MYPWKVEDPGKTVSTNAAWEDLYRAALVEACPELLRHRIDEAARAIQQRIADLRQDDCSSEEERRALQDALRGLRVIVKTECKPESPHSGPGEIGAAS